MAKDKLTQYDSTASNNTDVGGISVAEGMLPSGVNNAIREQMSHLADFAAGTSGVDVLKLQDDTDTNSIKLQAPSSVTADTTFTMPDGDGSADQVLKTDGSGQLGWADRHANPSLIINGAMTVSQRGTSQASVGSTSGYFTVDRFQYAKGGTVNGAFTMSQDTDVPSGQGFAKSLKMDVTTADASIGADAQYNIRQRIEGQNLQHLKKGTSSAESTTVSFWVKSNKTGTYIVSLVDTDNSRTISKSYTINSASTWEKKTITYDGDTTGTLDNDNAVSLDVLFRLGAGSNFTSGTLATSWESTTNANVAVGQVNVTDSTSNEWYITGVKLEVGSTATDFVHEDYGTTLRKCQRYTSVFEADGSFDNYAVLAIGRWFSGTDAQMYFSLPVTMRNPPSLDATNTTAVGTFSINVGGGLGAVLPTGISLNERSANAVTLTVSYSGGGQTAGQATTLYSDNADVAKVVFEAEL